MQNQNDVDTLAIYGKSFQSKTIISLLTNKVFMDQTFDMLTSLYFDSDSDKIIVDSIKEHYSKYKTYPSMEAFKFVINNLQNDKLKIGVKDRLRNIYSYQGATDLSFVQEKFIEFCKNQSLKNAIVQSVDLLKRAEYSEIRKVIETASRAGESRDIGHEYVEGVRERMTDVVRPTIPTGFSVIDDIMDGGLGPGELGIVVAPTGVGKTWMLSNIGAHAIENGYSVIHYTLELNQNYTGLRYDTIFTGINSQELRNNKDKVQRRIEGLSGDLVIKYFPNKSITTGALISHMERVTLLKKKPDLIIVDYADLLRSITRSADIRYLELGGIYEELRGMAGEYQIPIWSASQANRASLEEEVIQAQSVAESYSKVMTADFVISLSRKMNDKISNTGRWHIIKNRFGPDGLTYPSMIDTSIGLIKIYEGNSPAGIIASKQSVNGNDMIKKLLKKKHEQLTSNLD